MGADANAGASFETRRLRRRSTRHEGFGEFGAQPGGCDRPENPPQVLEKPRNRLGNGRSGPPSGGEPGRARLAGSPSGRRRARWSILRDAPLRVAPQDEGPGDDRSAGLGGCDRPENPPQVLEKPRNRLGNGRSGPPSGGEPGRARLGGSPSGRRHARWSILRDAPLRIATQDEGPGNDRSAGLGGCDRPENPSEVFENPRNRLGNGRGRPPPGESRAPRADRR